MSEKDRYSGLAPHATDVLSFGAGVIAVTGAAWVLAHGAGSTVSFTWFAVVGLTVLGVGSVAGMVFPLRRGGRPVKGGESASNTIELDEHLPDRSADH